MRAFFSILFLFIGSGMIAADRPVRDARAVEEAVAVQVFLDRANFGPGKIDGHLGDFTKKALDRYRRAKGGVESPNVAAEPPKPEQDAPAPAAVSTSGAPAATSGTSQSAASQAQPRGPTAELPEPSPLGVSSKPENAVRESAGADRRAEKPKEQERSQAETKPDVSDLDLASVGQVLVNYTVTEADAQAVGQVPSTPEEKARLKWLPYTSVAEAVAERFHMDVDFLEELNPGKAKNLRAGDVVRVPNVEPFDLNSVKDLKPGTMVTGKGANAEEPPAAAGEDAAGENDKNRRSAAKDDKKEKDARASKNGEKAEADAASTLSVVILKDENMLEVFDNDRMVAAFPVTVGSAETASPIGEWKVAGVAKFPEFRWDEKMLKQGERGDEFHLLPPGPNSPVGVVWIALNRKGVGIHGSDSPDAIGRNVSHGCIRLANWDVVKLASMVKTSVPVSIR